MSPVKVLRDAAVPHITPHTQPYGGLEAAPTSKTSISTTETMHFTEGMVDEKLESGIAMKVPSIFRGLWHEMVFIMIVTSAQLITVRRLPHDSFYDQYMS